MKIIKDLFTGIDGKTQDIGRWSWAMSMFALFAIVTANIYHNAVIDLVAFSQAVGAIVLAHGGAIFVKARTEPENGKTDSVIEIAKK